MKRKYIFILAVLSLLLNLAPNTALAAYGDYKLASLGYTGVVGNLGVTTTSLDMTSNGRYVLFSSDSTNLVANDTNSKRDLFLRDLTNNTISRVNVTSDGTQDTMQVSQGSVSDDGRFVVFWSSNANLVAGDTNSMADIFIRDLQLGTTSLISKNADGVLSNGDSIDAQISKDGRFVVFLSKATNLVSGVTSPVTYNHIYQKDITTGNVKLVDRTIDGNPSSATNYSFLGMSCDGRYIVFYSAANNLVTNDTNGQADVFLRDTVTDQTFGISSSGNTGGSYPEISCDGRYVVFLSASSNLVPNDNNSRTDIFTYDRVTSQYDMVSVKTNGTQGFGNGPRPSISDDGRFVVFTTESDLTTAPTQDGNSVSDVYVRDRVSRTTHLVSYRYHTRSAGNSATEGQITGDGRYIAYIGTDSNVVPVGDTNGSPDIFMNIDSRDIDRPSVVGTPSALPNGNNWYKNDISITWLSTDPLPSSGAPTQPSPTTANVEGTYTYESAQSCDPVLNCATGSLMLSIDKTLPTISSTLSDTANSYGWFKNDVTATFTCADLLSTILTCSSPVAFGEGANQSTLGVATDKADNQATDSVSGVNVDKTDGLVDTPTLSNNFIWVLSPSTTVTANASDALSGILNGELYIDNDPGLGNGIAMSFSSGQISKTMTITGLSAGSHTIYVRAIDKAGNWSNLTSVSFTYAL